MVANRDKDYYATLHLDSSADATMVQHAYWHLARALQTAANTDRSACRKLEALNEAYGVLGTPSLRKEYDRARRVAKAPPASDSAKAAKGRPVLDHKGESEGGRRSARRTVAFGLLPTLRRMTRLPAIPAIFLRTYLPRRARPKMRLPRPSLMQVKGITSRFPYLAHSKEAAIDAEALRASTVATLARWREEAKRLAVLPPFEEDGSRGKGVGS